MSEDILCEAISEIERLMNLPVDKRESEGVYADSSQLKLLLKRLLSRRNFSGMTKFVADFSSMDSKLLSLVDKLEGSGGA